MKVKCNATGKSRFPSYAEAKEALYRFNNRHTRTALPVSAESITWEKANKKGLIIVHFAKATTLRTGTITLWSTLKKKGISTNASWKNYTSVCKTIVTISYGWTSLAYIDHYDRMDL